MFFTIHAERYIFTSYTTQQKKNRPYLGQEADKGILTVEAGCTVVM